MIIHADKVASRKMAIVFALSDKKCSLRLENTHTHKEKPPSDSIAHSETSLQVELKPNDLMWNESRCRRLINKSFCKGALTYTCMPFLSRSLI